MRRAAAILATMTLMAHLPHSSAQSANPSDTAPGTTPFNRLLRTPSRPMPPSEDGFHDPGAPGTASLMSPEEEFARLPRRPGGNGVDWPKALAKGLVTPRWDREGKGRSLVFDMNVTRVPKGSMPDVVFPHARHTEWLDCSNCHPDVFVPQRGANHIDMASIALGEKCGLCHGKVAFPVSECRLCHSGGKRQSAPAPENKK